MPEPARTRIRVRGTVQGVGFRPFVHRLAHGLGLAGWVRNDALGVLIEAEGAPGALDGLEHALAAQAPPLAHIEQISSERIPILGERSFVIQTSSQAGQSGGSRIAPDAAVCEDCVRELFDPADRRQRYPFIVCTHCGPRFTITRALPYDRARTSMAPFSMCAQCAADYADPLNRRFHAQPLACADCGPHIWLANVHGGVLHAREAALPALAQALADGKIVAIKGVGGFHLTCDARNPNAIAMLRTRKQRPHKPFALMLPDLAETQHWASVDTSAARVLQSRQRPIVLLRKIILPEMHPLALSGDAFPATSLAELLAPDNACIGVMLPYSPLHHLLFAEPACPRALVMTSGNLSDEPICIDNDEAQTRLGALADLFLLHNREILFACDDSVVSMYGDGVDVGGRGEACLAPTAHVNPIAHDSARDNAHANPIGTIMVRRGRGWTPAPIQLPFNTVGIFACGGDLKHAFALADGNAAILGPPMGDLASLESQSAHRAVSQHLEAALGLTPTRVVCDAHPGYFSTRLALARAPTALRVQHHHAHAAALMAEHGLGADARIISIVCDGTGYGSDGSIWGGEVLETSYARAKRHLHLANFPLPGGDAAVQHPWRIALAALWQHGLAWDPALPCVAAANAVERSVLQQQLIRNLNCVPCSSLGRVFDAVAALLGLCQHATHEAQAALALEAVAWQVEPEAARQMVPALPFLVDGLGGISLRPLLTALLHDLQAGKPIPHIAWCFHAHIATLLVTAAQQVRTATGLNQVGLTGGVFHNTLLLSHTIPMLTSAGFEVLLHKQLSPGDGGLAIGQIAIAAHTP